MDLYGIDFSSAPTRRKPITVAVGRLRGDAVQLSRIDALDDLDAFERWLARPGPWLAVFDLPFGLPRAFVEEQGWPMRWAEVATLVGRTAREELRRRFRAYCDARPAGRKFAHRATDVPAGSSPSMKWVNPPVAWMFKEAVPRLLAAGVSVPGLHPGDPARIALEGYPGMLARSLDRGSYKSDDPRRQTPERAWRRAQLVGALRAGRLHLRTPVAMDDALAEALVADAQGDRLDAALCLSAAAWAWGRRDDGYGLPTSIDPLEGWIVGAAPAAETGR